jgi:23S rRNA pseudouridine2605 synthase
MKSSPASGSGAEPSEQGERLQKILARAGVASRRAAEELISAGRVKVNGAIVTEMGSRAQPGKDRIEVDGRVVAVGPAREQAEHTYIALNKPVGVVSTAKDTHGRPTVLDLIPRQEGTRLYPVGRLDVDTTGLLLLTNDGDLTFRLTHPRYGVDKEYRVLVRGRPNEVELRKLREGVEIEGEVTAPAKVEVVGERGGDTWLRTVIHEGRKRQVRMMAEAVGHPVIELQRVRFGPITLGNLEPGKWRHLAVHEVHALRKAVKLGVSKATERSGRQGRQYGERQEGKRERARRPAGRRS